MITGRVLVSRDVGMLLILGASITNMALGTFFVRRGRATSSLTLIADGKHVLTDSYTSVGVVAGTGLVLSTGIQMLDSICAIAGAVNIIYSGFSLMRISVGGLMDEADRETVSSVARIIAAERTAEWINVHHLRVLRSGPPQHRDFHLTIPFLWEVRKGQDFQHAITDLIAERFHQSAQVLVHLDSCVPACCPSCTIPSCAHRADVQTLQTGWSAEAMVGGPPFLFHAES